MQPPQVSVRPLRPAAALTTACLAGTVVAWLCSTTWADELTEAVAGMPWAPTLALLGLLVLAAVHYLCAAWAVWAVSDRELSLLVTTAVQLAAAASNRVIPNGIGGAGVNMRYLRRAGVSTGAAASAMTALAIVGAATDGGYATAVTVLGPAAGLTGATAELHVLAARGIQGGPHADVAIGAAALIVVGVYLLHPRRRGRFWARLAATLVMAFHHARGLVRHPARLGSACLASVLTTVALSVGFVISVHVWAWSPTPLSAGGLIAIYLVATAAGGATPLPPVFGITEGALLAALILSGYSGPSAFLAVAVFRGLTYWLPLPLGIVSARYLHRAQLL